MRTMDREALKDLKIAYIGGGSRGWAWGFMTDIALEGELGGEVRLYDIDRPAAERNRVIGERISAHPGAKARWRYTVADSLRSALTGADFAVISILPGTFREMRGDVHLPERLGIFQPVGDTVGAGGFMRAMRAVPMFAEFARAIRDFAPDAWVINYTNPMSLCVRTLYEIYPEIKAFGCCHEVFGTQELLCAMLRELLGAEGVRRQDLYTTVTGINHFTWLTAASWRGTDLMPLYARFADKYAEEGFENGRPGSWRDSFFGCAHRVKFDLFRRYGAIAAAGDRHLAEFVPPWYLLDRDTPARWKFSLTPVSWREEDLRTRLARSDRLAGGEKEIVLRPSGEEGHLLLKALAGLGDMVTNVNVPNRGQAPDLPLGAVVETNALFTRDRISPVCAGPLPPGVLPLVSRHVQNQENALRAALTCDRALGLSAFLNDPQLGRVSLAEGKRLFDDMLEAQRAYLPEGWFR